MPLTQGSRLGPYEILAPIGAGGMGEVYRARDTRLDREVAVKVLPEHLSRMTQLRQRFEREARSVSGLNHPNICSLYDIGREGTVDFMVMELLQGETLADRIRKGPLPTIEVIRIASEIADALDKAHKHGVLHRDLKPGNIMLTSSGAKLLDFGLAKSTIASGVSGMTAAPTAASPLTAEGSIVGTFQYMAPEIFEGNEADVRSDIFAFGTVLYEMITGRQTFEGKTRATLIASVLKEEPRPITVLAPLTPPPLERLVMTCLAKDPGDRRQTMHDVLLDLRWIRDAGSQAGAPAPIARRRRSRETVLTAVAAVAALLAITFAILYLQVSGRPERMHVSSLVAPEGEEFLSEGGFALSPDGARLVFVAGREDGTTSLHVRSLDRLTGQSLSETEGALYPFWSPDGRHIGFFAQGSLKRIDATGGPAQTLASAPSARGGTWSQEGTIIFSPNFRDGLQRVPAAGGPAEKITTLDLERGETSHRWPWSMPDGRLLFVSQTSEGGTVNDRSRFEALSLETGKRTPLFAGNSTIQYAPPSRHVLFWNDGTVYAQPFDPGSLEVSASPVPIAQEVVYTTNELAAFSISEDGTLVYHSGENAGGPSQLAWFDREGNRLQGVGEPGTISSPALSHDGTRVAYQVGDDLWVHDLKRGTSTRLTFDTTDEVAPVWSPDDRWIIYGSTRAAVGTLLRKQSSGLGTEELALELPHNSRPFSWSSDGKVIALASLNPETDWDGWLYSVEKNEAEPLVRTPFTETHMQISPDGNWLAYTSDESERPQVYVQRLTGPGGRWQISTNGGILPRWRADGKELFYVEFGTVNLMSVQVEAGETLNAGIPRSLFDAPIRSSFDYEYCVSEDGQRFLLNVLEGAETVQPLTLVQNWSRMVEAE